MKTNVIEMDQREEQVPSQDRKATLAQSLRHRILSMELAPGASLDEVALAEEFGLSRPPVRELMRQMAAEGYIELEANRAARVASMNFDSLRNYFLAAPLIYVATTKLAARHATKSEVDGLKRIQEQFRTAVEGNLVDDRVLENDSFHFAIGKMAHNAYLLPSLCRLLIDHARLATLVSFAPRSPENPPRGCGCCRRRLRGADCARRSPSPMGHRRRTPPLLPAARGAR